LSADTFAQEFARRLAARQARQRTQQVQADTEQQAQIAWTHRLGAHLEHRLAAICAEPEAGFTSSHPQPGLYELLSTAPASAARWAIRLEPAANRCYWATDPDAEATWEERELLTVTPEELDDLLLEFIDPAAGTEEA
jgi:hypothetical protein